MRDSTSLTTVKTTSSTEALPKLGKKPLWILGFQMPKRISFALPGLIIYTVLVMLPLILSFYFSLTDRNLLSSGQNFVGISNYIRLFADSQFLHTFGFSLTLTAITLISVNILGLSIAVLLNKVGRLFFAMRMLFFVPVALSGAIVAFLWSTILTDHGLLNTMLRNVNLESLTGHWLGTPINAQGSIILVSSWQSISLCVVVYLAGLQTIPKDYLDAARIDGCGPILTFRQIIWPLLAPSATINSTLLLINGFKAYDIPVVLTATGPGHATSTIATEVIRVGFSLNRVGVASAMAVIMVIVVATITITLAVALQKRELVS